jgi:hypothetical protein
VGRTSYRRARSVASPQKCGKPLGKKSGKTLYYDNGKRREERETPRIAGNPSQKE